MTQLNISPHPYQSEGTASLPMRKQRFLPNLASNFGSLRISNSSIRASPEQVNLASVFETLLDRTAIPII
jgi:hypothetical protein